ncbi:hypothetical protein HDU84_008945, partial [Entophlyctis sp. JEL0112]
SNEHRLGANEAPPAIVSAFLGAQLAEVLDAIEEGREVKPFSAPSGSADGTKLDLKISTLPPIARDFTDRNRTSPFAFTGNKFEFRAVGSKQSPSFPVVLLNAAVAKSVDLVNEALIAIKGDKPVPSEEDILAVVRQFVVSSKLIRFEGNGYSDEWVAEAAARGLPNIKSCPEAFKQLITESSAELLVSQGVLSSAELHSRYHIQLEKYAKDLLIEGETLFGMIDTGVLPASFTYRKELADSINSQASAGVDAIPEKKLLTQLTELSVKLQDANEHLKEVVAKVESLHGDDQGIYAGEVLTVAMEEVRKYSDALETKVADKYWPFPKYTELLL